MIETKRIVHAVGVQGQAISQVVDFLPRILTGETHFVTVLICNVSAQIEYSLNDEGCDINGTTKSYGGEFSLDITGPCVTYLCSTTGVSMKEGAGETVQQPITC